MRLHGSRKWRLLVVGLTCVALAVSGDALAKEKAKPKGKAKPKEKEQEAAPSQLPWSLRDHFRFTWGKSLCYYAVENGEWTLMVEGLGAILENVGFRITFADGSTLDAAGLGKAENERENFSNADGKGTIYRNGFPPKDGLQVYHGLAAYADRPYVLIRVGLANNGDKPVEIAKISPVVPGPGGIAHLAPDTEVSTRRLISRGAFPVFDKSAPPILTIFRDRADDITLSLGVLAQGVASSSAEFLAGGGAG